MRNSQEEEGKKEEDRKRKAEISWLPPNRGVESRLWGSRTPMFSRSTKHSPQKKEAAPGFEPGMEVLQTSALASWLCRQKNGAGNGT